VSKYHSLLEGGVSEVVLNAAASSVESQEGRPVIGF